ncbi:MAG: hypothetical protein JJU18_09035 [Oceanicaulis sp.]|nr:hypothetical protein [Oceanicaulis sp.]
MNATEANCPSANAARELTALLAALDNAQTPGQAPERAKQLDDRLEAALDAASWSRPKSAEGALLHVVLGASIAADIARARDPESQERRAMRHFYAARAYLETAGELPEQWARLFAFAMPATDDHAPEIAEALSA